MRTPLGPGYQARVLWQDTASAHEVARADPPATVDVAVVGGGYCGLSAATELVRRGRTVAVLDAHDLGWGASTRNGGMVLAEVEAAFDHVEGLVADGPIDCAYERSGQLYLSHGERSSAHLDALAAELTSVGSPAHVVRGDALQAELGSHRFAAGLVVERSGG